MKDSEPRVEPPRWNVQDMSRWLRDDLKGLGAPCLLRRLAATQMSRALPDFYFRTIRTQLFRWAGVDISRGSSFLGHVQISGPEDAAERLRIGPGSMIGPGVRFDLEGEIIIGINVAIGPHCILTTSTHTLGVGSRRMSNRVVSKPIVIEDGAWVGVGSMVLPGVRIGRGAVVSAGAVVTKSVEPNTLVAGNPAVLVKRLPLGDR
jgi:maltose O-acetyltransferase